MLNEGLVGVVAMIGASTLAPQDYYAMNVKLAEVPKWHDRIEQMGGGGGVEHVNLYDQRTQESLRGRTGGAGSLAGGIVETFEHAPPKITSASPTAPALLRGFPLSTSVHLVALVLIATLYC